MFGLINIGESEQPLRTGMKGRHFSMTYDSILYMYSSFIANRLVMKSGI